MQKWFSGLLIGLFAGLWWSERQKNQQRATVPASPPEKQEQTATEPRRSRTLEEMSKTYAANPHPFKELYVVPPGEIYAFADGLTRELIRPDLTELEARNIADYLRRILIASTDYQYLREFHRTELTQQWINDAIDQAKDEDDE